MLSCTYHSFSTWPCELVLHVGAVDGVVGGADRAAADGGGVAVGRFTDDARRDGEGAGEAAVAAHGGHGLEGVGTVVGGGLGVRLVHRGGGGDHFHGGAFHLAWASGQVLALLQPMPTRMFLEAAESSPVLATTDLVPPGGQQVGGCHSPLASVTRVLAVNRALELRTNLDPCQGVRRLFSTTASGKGSPQWSGRSGRGPATKLEGNERDPIARIRMFHILRRSGLEAEKRRRLPGLASTRFLDGLWCCTWSGELATWIVGLGPGVPKEEDAELQVRCSRRSLPGARPRRGWAPCCSWSPRSGTLPRRSSRWHRRDGDRRGRGDGAVDVAQAPVP